MKPDGSLDLTLQLGSLTSYIHFIEESQKLVVTSGRDKSITIIDMKNRKTEKLINFGSWIYGVAHKDGKLVYNGYNRGICVVSLDNVFITQLVNATLSKYSSIVIWLDQLYYINNDSVTCCDLQRTLKWKLERKPFLRGARGITLDNHGRVYVSGFESHNVVVISADGKNTECCCQRKMVLNGHKLCSSIEKITSYLFRTTKMRHFFLMFQNELVQIFKISFL
ncbi:unnamed protein product [Mytilus coruscus]|uniref:Uncharacterized protein n=1 Tax=Mytilus coruscus TaxID=42192 RepID=A0A6J8C2Y3_MYTCO|nr:unnamed protein product [Mytilus coruscus]